jgi:hypothetical protein
MSRLLIAASAALAAVALASPVSAQRPASAQPAQAQQQGAGGAQPQPQQQVQQQQPAEAAPRWDGLPPMVLERVFRGPLRDTVVQRWRDPVDNSVCFIYLPMRAAIAGQGEQLVYGANTIGSLSCFSPGQVLQLQVNGAAPQPAATPAPASTNQPAQRSR